MSENSQGPVAATDGENLSLKRLFIDSSPWMYLIYAMALTMALFHILVLAFYPLEPWLFSMGNLQFGVALGFVYYASRAGKRGGVTFVDLLLILLSVASYIYVTLNIQLLLEREGAFPEDLDLVFGTITLLVVLELTRRTAGNVLTALLLIALAYCWAGPWLPGILAHKGFSPERIVCYMFSQFGIFNSPLNATARFVYIFVLFGAFLELSGAAAFFMNLSYAAAGGTRGGPAKVAVVSSALLGMMSGAATANVVTTGAMTIPLMKRTGYSSYFAGAVEAVASTGGQFMPPVMGAAVFLMAQMMGESYTVIMVAAVIPAILYYIALMFSVDMEAQRLKLFGLERSKLLSWKSVLSESWLGLPILVLLAFLTVLKMSVVFAGLGALCCVIVVGALRSVRSTGRIFSMRAFLNTVRDGGVNCVPIIATTAAAGIIIGALTLTGLGLKISTIVVAASHGNLLLCLLFTMFVTLLLGMGMPTIAAYAIPAAVVVPALVELGVPLLPAHLFVLYFAALSSITPPVALASFAAAAIARCNPFKLGLVGVKLALPAFIIPYMFVYGPELTLDGSIPQIMRATVTACNGVWAISTATIGYLRGELSIVMRILFFISALLMIDTGLVTDIAGIATLSLLVTLRIWKQRAHSGTKNSHVSE